MFYFWLVHDYSMLSGNLTIHNTTDLKSCYDRQLAQIGSIIEEAIRIERKLIKLITKLLLVIKHHICTAYRVSNQYYSGKNDKVVGIGQGYVVSSNVCQDSSGFTIKQVKDK